MGRLCNRIDPIRPPHTVLWSARLDSYYCGITRQHDVTHLDYHLGHEAPSIIH